MKYFLITCGWVLAAAGILPGAVDKPVGCFASSGGIDDTVIEHPCVNGVLVRASWSDIEPQPDTYDFSRIVIQAAKAKAAGKGWSLAVAGGGTGSPGWLTDSLGAAYIDYSFRGVPGYRLPLYWDDVVQQRIAVLIDTLGKRFAGDDDLKLVYVMQMSANGNEGHLQGVDMTVFRAAGFTERVWIDAARYAAGLYAAAFPQKAVAIEVHEIDHSAAIPETLINELWNDPALEQRVGAAMWWISGKTSYQPDLLQVLRDFPGDLYGQVIGRSDEPERFADSCYATVFIQARELGMRYIEPWEYEFKNHTSDSLLAGFNAWADSAFSVGPAAVGPDRGRSRTYPGPTGLRVYAPGDCGIRISQAHAREICIHSMAGALLWRSGTVGNSVTWRHPCGNVPVVVTAGTPATEEMRTVFIWK